MPIIVVDMVKGDSIIKCFIKSVIFLPAVAHVFVGTLELILIFDKTTHST